MLVIRLSRTGRTKRPHYRVVVAEKSAAVKGRYLEVLGHFDPRTKELKIDADRAKARLAKGAQPSETAEMLLEKAGILKRDKITEKNRRPERKKRKEAKAEGDEAAKPDGGEAATADGDASASTSTDGAQPAKQSDDKPTDDAATDDKPADKPAEATAEDKKAAEKDEDKDKDKAKEKGGS